MSSIAGQLNPKQNICKITGILILTLAACVTVCAQKQIHLSSPDKRLRFSFMVTTDGPLYRVNYNDKPIVDFSSLELSFKDGIALNKIRIERSTSRELKEEYDLVVGKAKHVMAHCNELTLTLSELSPLARKINLIVRAYNDGVAFRWAFPEQPNWNSYILTNERSGFSIHGNPKVLTLFRPDYNTSHEGRYDHLRLKAVKTDTLMDLPTLFEMEDGNFMAVTEAALVDYAGMYLIKKGDNLVSELSSLQNEQDVKVKASFPHKTPWRVMIISDKVSDLLSSNILTNLNEPQKIHDVSWIKPGKTTFHWWNGDIIPDTTIAPGVNFEFNKYYIDFCARNKIEYHAVIGYGGFAWYKSDAQDYGTVGPNTDVTETVPSLDMQQVCDYARQKGVGIHVWVNWKAIYPQLETAFAKFERWGIKGMMVDFMDRDDQEMVNIQTKILETAARYHLYLQFHGAYKPTGLNRTYPNEFTREGTLNYENNKWNSEPISPEHDLDIVFTRLLAGAADYHLGGFRAVSPKNFKPQFTRPLMIGTRCHMLAMYVVLESYLVSLCDYPQAYEGQAGFDFLRRVPTVWDETKVINAAVSKYISIARRKDSNWYIGTINNSEARDLTLNLSFLPDGEYIATIYSDAADSESNPNHLVVKTMKVNNTDSIIVKLSGGGGQVVELVRL